MVTLKTDWSDQGAVPCTMPTRERNTFGTAFAATFGIIHLISAFISFIFGYVLSIIEKELHGNFNFPLSPADLLIASATLLLSGVAFFVSFVVPWLVGSYVWAKALPWAGFGVAHLIRLIVGISGNSYAQQVGTAINVSFLVYYSVLYLLYAFVPSLRPLKDTFKKENVFPTGQQFMYASPMAYQSPTADKPASPVLAQPTVEPPPSYGSQTTIPSNFQTADLKGSKS